MPRIGESCASSRRVWRPRIDGPAPPVQAPQAAVKSARRASPCRVARAVGLRPRGRPSRVPCDCVVGCEKLRQSGPRRARSLNPAVSRRRVSATDLRAAPAGCHMSGPQILYICQRVPVFVLGPGWEIICILVTSFYSPRSLHTTARIKEPAFYSSSSHGP